jgi:hypothetical protein
LFSIFTRIFAGKTEQPARDFSAALRILCGFFLNPVRLDSLPSESKERLSHCPDALFWTGRKRKHFNDQIQSTGLIRDAQAVAC